VFFIVSVCLFCWVVIFWFQTVLGLFVCLCLFFFVIGRYLALIAYCSVFNFDFKCLILVQYLSDVVVCCVFGWIDLNPAVQVYLFNVLKRTMTSVDNYCTWTKVQVLVPKYESDDDVPSADSFDFCLLLQWSSSTSTSTTSTCSTSTVLL
jgi:hypothetical protein